MKQLWNLLQALGFDSENDMEAINLISAIKSRLNQNIELRFPMVSHFVQ
jgi:hypothetical protein